MKKTLDELLPHRPPFRFLDRLLEARTDGCVGEYTFTADAYFFKGHFPGFPVVPGVLLVEAIAQCGGAGVVESDLVEARSILLATVSSAKFRRPVRPDETVRFEVEYMKTSPRLLRQRGKAFVGGEIAAEAEWVCIVGKDMAKA